MNPRPAPPEGPFLVAGLGISGVAAARTLVASGELVRATDSGSPQTADVLPSANIEPLLESDGVELLAGTRTVVKSPGVPQSAPLVLAAREQGIAVIGDLELAWQRLPNWTVAVTGTNGKTTTSELLGHIYRTAGLPVEVAGNVGRALCDLVLEQVSPEVPLVIESSSFQLEDSPSFAPDVAVLLNITPDHLDRHGSFEQYEAAKLAVFARQAMGSFAVIPPAFKDRIGGEATRIVIGEQIAVSADDQIVWHGKALLPVAELGIRGPHNLFNAMAAAAAALVSGVSVADVAAGLRSFPGVRHRLEAVAEHAGVAYVNDSKATNVASAVVALQSFDSGVHLICGGRGKGTGYSELAEPVSERCSAVYLIGESATEIAADLAKTGVPLRQSGTLETAVAEASANAKPGDTVLLSPACASFDQFGSYEQRGDAFRKLAQELSE